MTTRLNTFGHFVQETRELLIKCSVHDNIGTNIQGVADNMHNEEFISLFSYQQLFIDIYNSVSNSTLFFIYYYSLLHVFAVSDHHQASVYLAKTVTLHLK